MKTNFKKRFWMSAGIILGSAVLGMAAIFYLSGDLHANASAIVSDQAAIQAQDTALDRLAELESDAPVAATYISAYNELMPDQYRLINFQNWLDASAKNFNVAAAYTFQGSLPTVAPGAIGTVPISLNIQGPLSGVSAFLENLETKSSAFLVRIDSYTITQDASHNAQFTGQGVIFFQ